MKAEQELLARGNSILHQWDARWKLVALSVFILITAIVHQPDTALLCLILSLVLLLFGRLPLNVVIKRLAVIHLFLIPCFVFFPLTVSGETWQQTRVHFSREGLMLAVLLYLRAVAIVSATLVLIYTTPMNHLLRAGEYLKIPRFFIQITLLTYRYIFTLADDLAGMRRAVITRGFRNRTALRSYRTLANMVGLTLIRSLERTERIYRAMQCRGYRGYMCSLQTFSTRWPDVIISIVLILLSVILVCIDRVM